MKLQRVDLNNEITNDTYRLPKGNVERQMKRGKIKRTNFKI